MKNEYDYAYAILRADEYQGPECPIEYKVTVKKVVLDADAAEREVQRLNALRKEGVRYFSQVTRLEKREVAIVATTSCATWLDASHPGPVQLQYRPVQLQSAPVDQSSLTALPARQAFLAPRQFAGGGDLQPVGG